MSIHLRPLQMSDCEAAGAIVGDNALWRDRYLYTSDKAARDLLYACSHGDYVLGAFSNKLVGFAWVVPKGAFARSPYLRLIAVSPDAHGQGVGKKLLAAAESQFQSNGAKHFFLLVSDFNKEAQRFYGSQGYGPIGAVPDFVLAGVAEQLWMKRL